MHTPLQGREAGTLIGVEGDDLAVEDRAVRAERADETVELGIGVLAGLMAWPRMGG